jgi:DNA polymerase-3 subunit gamma/tau
MRQAWPQVLEAVARRGKVAWVMLQSVHVVGVEGRLLQLGFSSSGLRDNFHGSNREETLREALREVTGMDWKIDALVDPSAGTAAPGVASGPLPVASVPAPVAVAPVAPMTGSSAGGGLAASSGAGASSSGPAVGVNSDLGVATAPTAPIGFAAGPPPAFAQPTTPPEEDEPDPDDEDVADAGVGRDRA